MALSDEKIIDAYNKAFDAGHPDPAGFIVRGEIKTGLDIDGEYKGAVGAFGVDKKKALDIGFTEDEIYSTDGNIQAALEIDMLSLRKTDGDSFEMFRESNPKSSKKSLDRFIKNLDRRKRSFHDKLVFDSDGRLIQIDRTKKEKNFSDNLKIKIKYDENGNEIMPEVTSKKTFNGVNSSNDSIVTETTTSRLRTNKGVPDAVVVRKAVDVETADDIVKNVATYVYQKNDKVEIDGLLKKLVEAIVDEKPIGRIL